MTLDQASSEIHQIAETIEFKALIDSYYAAWSFAISNNGLEALDCPASFYAKDKGLVFYDPRSPLEGHHDWEHFKVDVVKIWNEAGIVTADIRRSGKPQIWQRGDLAWAAVPHQATVALKEGQLQTVEQRQTFVWQRRDGQWLIVHEHASAAVSLGSNLPQRSGATPVGQHIAEFSQLIHDFWNAWNTRKVEAAARFYAKSPDLVVYLPWRTEGFMGWEAFKSFANQVMQDMETVQFTPDDNVHVLQFGDIAVTAGIFDIKLKAQDGKMTQGDARYTLIWAKLDGEWQIVHEHLSSTVS